MIKVLIVDDIPETRDHLTRLLSTEEGIDVAGGAGSGEEAIQMAMDLRPDVVASLTRPYPVATNGTPLELSFDPTTRVLRYRWSVRRPTGRRGREDVETSIVLPTAVYPTGVVVDVQGGQVVSQPGEPHLRVRNLLDAGAVRLTVSPAP